jgi:hypothetical protein
LRRVGGLRIGDVVMSIPVVPLSAFCNLAGVALGEDIRRLVARRGLSGLVLFSDTLGEHLAVLPVGEGQPYGRVKQVIGVEIEGLRPLCALDLLGEDTDDERSVQLARREEGLKARELELADQARALTEATVALKEREALVKQAEQALLNKERDFFRRGGEQARRGVEKVSVSSNRAQQEAAQA